MLCQSRSVSFHKENPYFCISLFDAILKSTLQDVFLFGWQLQMIVSEKFVAFLSWSMAYSGAALP